MGSTALPNDDNLTFRDLNKNGRLDAYEDPRRPIDERIANLLGRMTLSRISLPT